MKIKQLSYEQFRDFLSSYTKSNKHKWLHVDRMKMRNCCKIDEVVENIDTINYIYQTIKAQKWLNTIKRTPSGSIAQSCLENSCAYDVYVKNLNNQTLGVQITVILGRESWVFKFGQLTANKKSNMSGAKAFELFAQECKKQNVDLEKYALSKEDGYKEYYSISRHKIENYKLFKEIEHVNHIDFNKAFPSCLCEKYPEFEKVFKSILEKRKDAKYIVDPAIGYMRSPYLNYKYSKLAKAAVDGNNYKLIDITINLKLQGFEVLGYNTDGIWYHDLTNQNRLYHDENEGLGLHKWKHDHIDVLWYAQSDGQYYYIEDNGKGKFTPVLRGAYHYAKIKPRENWDCREDFFKAIESYLDIIWKDEVGFVIIGGHIDVKEKETNKKRN